MFTLGVTGVVFLVGSTCASEDVFLDTQGNRVNKRKDSLIKKNTVGNDFKQIILIIFVLLGYICCSGRLVVVPNAHYAEPAAGRSGQPLTEVGAATYWNLCDTFPTLLYG